LTANLPYRIIENAEFRELLEYLDEDVELFSHETLTRDVQRYSEENKQ
jgi:hypothetical protein